MPEKPLSSSHTIYIFSSEFLAIANTKLAEYQHAMGEFLLGQAVGFLMGLAGSFFSWWVLTHHLKPNVAFGEFISRGPHGLDQSRIGYRFKFENTSKRPLYEVGLSTNAEGVTANVERDKRER